ncbi:MAG: hypothetical protein ACFNKE_10830, partial [Neisseria elongata]
MTSARRQMRATALVGAAGFLTAVVGQDTAYTWLLNVSALCGFIVWLGIAVCHFRFRRAYVLQGHDPADLPYRAPWFPLGPVLAFILCALVILGQNYEAVFKGQLLEVLSSSGELGQGKMSMIRMTHLIDVDG